MNGTFYAVALITVGALLVWAGMTGTSILTALAFGSPSAGQPK